MTPPESPPGSARGLVPALVAALLALAAGLAVISPELGSMGGDNADYVLLAKAVRDGTGYRTTWGPGDPPLHTLYPPVFPLLLVPFVGGAPGSFLAAHVLVALAGAAAVLLLARLFAARGLPPWAAAAGALAPALSILWLRCTADILSELPFLALSAGALLALEPAGPGRLPPRRVALAAALAALAFLARTAGLALALPVAAVLAVDRRTRGRTGWLAAGAILAAVGGWFLYGRLAGGPGTGYLAQIGEGGGAGGFLGRAWDALWGLYLPQTPSFLFPHRGPGWTAAGWALWIAAGAGAVLGLRRRGTLAATEGFLLATLLLQSAWPFQDPRFALPLAALLVPLALEAVHAAARRLAPARPALPVLALSVLLLLPNVHRLFGLVLPRAHRDRPAVVPGEREPAGFADTWTWNEDQYRQAAPPLAAFLHACDLVRTGGIPGLPPGPVMASNPRVAALLSGRPAVRPLPGAGPAAQAALARETGVALVIVDRFRGDTSEALRAWRDAGSGDLAPLLRLPGEVQVFAFRR